MRCIRLAMMISITAVIKARFTQASDFFAVGVSALSAPCVAFGSETFWILKAFKASRVGRFTLFGHRISSNTLPGLRAVPPCHWLCSLAEPAQEPFCCTRVGTYQYRIA